MESRFLRNVLLKGLAIFVVINLLVAGLPTGLGKISLYNVVFDGRLRFPFGEDSAQSYNLSLFDLDAMFAAHAISGGPKPVDEYRVIVVGDSSTWGTLLRPEETLAGLLDAAGLSLCGKQVRVYNLGYPTISLIKDLMILDYAPRYQPDLVIWLTTLEAFPDDKQLTSAMVANNAVRIDDLVARYDLSVDTSDPAFVRGNFWSRTLIGQRRPLADLFRLQMYGILWSATGIDQSYPDDYTPAQTDFDTDITFFGMSGPTLDESRLAFDILEAGLAAVAGTPVLMINEPMLISTGENSDLRYNFFYPRWAYDDWRQMMLARAVAQGWNYLDLWDIVPADQFTNSAIHMTPAGEKLLAEQVESALSGQSCP
jgi:hypothetical protein